MDAQSRGRADEVDPADQWVLNPQTGNYELRLSPSGPESSPSAGASSRRSSTPGRSGSAKREVPGQRDNRRGTKDPEDGTGRRKRKPKASRKKKVLLWTGGVMGFVLVAGSAGAYLLYQHFNNNLNTVDVGDAGNKNATSDGPVNILIIGTDKRTGKGNEGYGDQGSEGHADTNILFHVSKDRTNATALSIPRDLVTNIPECPTKQKDGSTKNVPGESNVRFNTSLGQEGRDPGCTMRTVKALTGLDVDHFMMADFNAVKELSTAVGGVKVCLAKPVNDPKSHLKLPAGISKIEGEQALAFVRTRHSFGNESDLDRIKQQQQFLGSMMRQMKSDSTLSSPTKVFSLANAATKALTVDSGIGSIKKLTSLAQDLSKVDLKNVTFATLPVIDNPADGKVRKTVVVDPTKAPQVFSMMKSDISFTEVKKKENAAKDAQAALLKGTRAPASAVRVQVLNGGAQPGSASKTLLWLQNSKGVLKSDNGGNAPAKLADTTLVYAPNQADQARELADLMGLPASALKPADKDAVGRTPMELTLGADFKGAGVPIAAPSKAPEGIQKVEADKSVCAK
ncbi:LCP family protein [Streptomyces sp. CBMA152]|uniref:LCP family protein n=1 Tax=Streptomyces sp. CBMA152 TaxID=1896312 RepID=UPI0016601F4D|nr:LCP family protein [Streptomyces sp. CBMA152]MBD0746587.1 LytR family transcriptional regulator [Streptomyces sp. CBMA152]